MKALIWSKDMCPYCDRAKALLTSKGIQYEERRVGGGWTKQQLLESVPNARTVPQIFLDEVLIGGYDQLKAFFDKRN